MVANDRAQPRFAIGQRARRLTDVAFMLIQPETHNRVKQILPAARHEIIKRGFNDADGFSNLAHRRNVVTLLAKQRRRYA